MHEAVAKLDALREKSASYRRDAAVIVARHAHRERRRRLVAG